MNKPVPCIKQLQDRSQSGDNVVFFTIKTKTYLCKYETILSKDIEDI